MKKKTLRLMNGVAQMIENSNPYLNKKGKKLVFENFMYNSMLNELSRLAEGVDDEDTGFLSGLSTKAGIKGKRAMGKANQMWDDAMLAGRNAKRYFSSLKGRNDGSINTDFEQDMKDTWNKAKGRGKYRYNQAKEYLFGPGEGATDELVPAEGKPMSGLERDISSGLRAAKNWGNSTMDFALNNPGKSAAIAATIAITGWGAKKAYDFVKKNGPEAVEALKDKVKPSMMGKVKAKFKKLMAKMAFAESVGVNPLKVLKK